MPRLVRFCLPLLTGFALPALTGCIDTPRPQPALDVPGAYANAPKRPETRPVVPDWWRTFGSPELAGFVAESQTGNLDIAIAVARIAEADAQAKIAGSALFPQIGASATLSRSRTSTPGSVGQGTNRFNPAFLATYEIDFWGQNQALLASAEFLAQASRFDRDTVALTTAATTASLYVRILAARERIRIARQNLDAAERVLTIIRERLDVGTATALDLAQQESVVATIRANIPALEQTSEQDVTTLAVLLGRAPERIRVMGKSLDALRLPRIDAGLPSTLLERRPDIAAAEARLESAHANVNAARAAFFPTINLTAQGGFASVALSSLFNPGSGFYAVSAGLTQPIFQGFLLQGQYEQQQARQLELLQAYRSSVINGFADVERALIALRQLGQQEVLQRAALASSRRAYDIAVQRLAEGTVDLVTVLQTQTTLFQAEDALTQARANRYLAAIALYQALGGGWGKGDADKPAP
ncbi:efflux transporter outer membrane subunit [Rhizobiales bacterium TNE-4]|nr:efflux transporter outer membrane subunit [Rhizobiales bacterium TNE-4]MBV1828682.1 efflux transporter outer membrane subunit [Rhizobiales bacterium TNE-4]